MTTAEPRSTREAPKKPPARPLAARRDGHLPSALAVPALATVAAVLLLAGGALMRVPEASGFLGPRFFPLAVAALLLATAVGSAAWALYGSGSRNRTARKRRPSTGRPAADDGGADAAATPRSDWRTLATMAATLAAHVVLLMPLGWLLAGTLLFWGVSYALDRRRPLLDLCIAAALAGVVQLVFSGLLGVALPAGVVGKVL